MEETPRSTYAVMSPNGTACSSIKIISKVVKMVVEHLNEDQEGLEGRSDVEHEAGVVREEFNAAFVAGVDEDGGASSFPERVVHQVLLPELHVPVRLVVEVVQSLREVPRLVQPSAVVLQCFMSCRGRARHYHYAIAEEK